MRSMKILYKQIQVTVNFSPSKAKKDKKKKNK